MAFHRLIAEFNKLGEGLTPETPLDSKSELTKLMTSFFNFIYWEAHYDTEHASVRAFFDVDWKPDERVTGIGSPRGRSDRDPLRIVRIVADETVVQIAVEQRVERTTPDAFEPVMEWVDIDENHRERRPVLDKNKQPKMKKKKAETVSTNEVFTYKIPLPFFVELLAEIDRDSIIDLPKDYVPEPLGGQMAQIFGQGLAFAMMNSPWSYDAPWPPHGKMLMSRQSHRYDNVAPKPFRVFMKPEPGAERFELMFEPYSDEEIRTRADLIANRREWATGQITKTKTMQGLVSGIKAKIRTDRQVRSEAAHAERLAKSPA